jgi:helix-hairpin-helix protein
MAGPGSTSPGALEPWSLRQRCVILVFVVGILGYLAIQYWREPVDVSDPPPAMGVRAGELEDRLDPNTASAAMLAAIPQMGEKRAKEIVDFREEFQRENPGQSAFAEPHDLLKLKNFGVATLATVGPYLAFPPAPPAAPDITPTSETQSTERSE